MSEPTHTRIDSGDRAKAAEGGFFEREETKIAGRGGEGMITRARGRRENGREREVVAGEARDVDR